MANDKGPKWLSVMTPVGTLGWCSLREPDVYKPKKGPQVVKWKAKYILTDSDEDKAMLSKLLEYENKCREFEKLDTVDEPSCVKEYNGERYIEPYMKTERGVPLFVDAANKATAYRPNKGDRCRLQFKAAFQDINGSQYLSLYLEGVQVVDVSGGGAAAFTPVDGGWVDENPEPAPAPAAASTSSDGDSLSLDDIPF